MFFLSKSSSQEKYMIFTGFKSTKGVADGIIGKTFYFDNLDDIIMFVFKNGLVQSYIFTLDKDGYYRYLCDAKFFMKHIKGE